jgi:hypothetical protein
MKIWSFLKSVGFNITLTPLLKVSVVVPMAASFVSAVTLLGSGFFIQQWFIAYIIYISGNILTCSVYPA